MALLEDIKVGASIVGLIGNTPVTVVAVKWHGTAVLTLTFKDSKGHLAISCYIGKMKSALV